MSVSYFILVWLIVIALGIGITYWSYKKYKDTIYETAERAKQTAEYAKGIAEYAKKQDDRWRQIDDYYKEVVRYLWLINCHGSRDNETLREIKDDLVSQITKIDRRMYEIEQKQVHNSGEK